MAAKDQWCGGAETFRLTATTAPRLVTGEPALLLGVVIDTGGAAARCRVYDQATDAAVDVANRKAVAKAIADSYDGDVNFPRLMKAGIVAEITDAAAEAFIYWMPLPATA